MNSTNYKISIRKTERDPYHGQIAMSRKLDDRNMIASRCNNAQNLRRRVSPLKSNKLQNSGMLAYPPGYIPNRYYFEQGQHQQNSLCGCCPKLDHSQSEIYISPCEVITREHFIRESTCYFCLPKSNRN